MDGKVWIGTRSRLCVDSHELRVSQSAEVPVVAGGLTARRTLFRGVGQPEAVEPENRLH